LFQHESYYSLVYQKNDNLNNSITERWVWLRKDSSNELCLSVLSGHKKFFCEPELNCRIVVLLSIASLSLKFEVVYGIGSYELSLLWKMNNLCALFFIHSEWLIIFWVKITLLNFPEKMCDVPINEWNIHD